MKFAQESYSLDLLAEMEPLLEFQYLEIAHWKDIPMDPDFQAFERCDKAGILRIFTARQQGILQGYAFFFINRNPHFKQSVQAVNDILFLSPAMRKGLNGYRFIKWCDEQLAKEVQVVFHHVSRYLDFGKVLERMGYEQINLQYGHRLDLTRKPLEVSCV